MEIPLQKQFPMRFLAFDTVGALTLLYCLLLNSVSLQPSGFLTSRMVVEKAAITQRWKRVVLPSKVVLFRRWTGKRNLDFYFEPLTMNLKNLQLG
jgi:hypothetical protein